MKRGNISTGDSIVVNNLYLRAINPFNIYDEGFKYMWDCPTKSWHSFAEGLVVAGFANILVKDGDNFLELKYNNGELDEINRWKTIEECDVRQQADSNLSSCEFLLGNTLPTSYDVDRLLDSIPIIEELATSKEISILAKANSISHELETVANSFAMIIRRNDMAPKLIQTIVDETSKYLVSKSIKETVNENGYAICSKMSPVEENAENIVYTTGLALHGDDDFRLPEVFVKTRHIETAKLIELLSIVADTLLDFKGEEQAIKKLEEAGYKGRLLKRTTRSDMANFGNRVVKDDFDMRELRIDQKLD